MSFKYGDFEGIRNNCFFTDTIEDSFAALIDDINELVIHKEYVTPDVRVGREDEKWLNVFCREL